MKEMFTMKAWRQHRRELGVVAAGSLVIVLLAGLVLWPLSAKKRRLEMLIREMSARLAQHNYGGDESTLNERKANEQRANLKLRTQWNELVSRLSVFPDQRAIANSVVGHIDYKVALHHHREKLMLKSKTVAIPMPYDLGMDETIGSDQDARKLMFQLKAINKVVDIVLDSDTKRITRIAPLPSLQHKVGDEENEAVYLEEYPVFISREGDMESLYGLIHLFLNEGNTCIFRHMRIQSMDAGDNGLLQIDAVLSALVFTKTLDDLQWALVQAPTDLNPAGY